MKKILVVLLAILFLPMVVVAQGGSMAQVEGAADLEKVKRAKFRETYVNVETDFSKYTKIYLGDAHFDYRDAGPAQRYRSHLSSSGKGIFGISQGDRDKFEKYVDEAFIKELSQGKTFKIVESLDAQTMIMRGAMVDIVSRVPPEFVGRSEVYLASVGEATLVLEFLDGSTGEVLARIAERRSIGSPGGMGMMTMPSNSVTVWADVKRWAGNSARRLRTELDAAISEG